MSCAHVLLVNLESQNCPEGSCDQVPRLFREGLADFRCSGIKSSELEFYEGKPHATVLRSHSLEHMRELLRRVRAKWSKVPVLGVFCFPCGDSGEFLSCFQNGLDDFVVCPVREFDLCVRTRQLVRQAVLEPRIDLPPAQPHFDFLVGESPLFTQLLSKLPSVASSNMTVLLAGETGTGKELVARAIHYLSPRRGHPFIPLNSASLPDHLLENELFGHAKGAYTDASTSQAGLLATAEGGTLFLDEIDALSLTAQVKLLRLLQDREYRPLGSNRTLVANIRVIAATNADLRQRVHDHTFREDLFHRLNVLHISIPPLRERSDDIPRIANHFLEKVAQQEAREIKRLTWAALEKLQSYDWPGNVRELEGVIQRAVIMSPVQTLDWDQIELPTDVSPARRQLKSLRQLKSDAIKQLERCQILSLLSACRGNVTRAAREAGTTRRTLQRLIRKYALQRHQFASPGQRRNETNEHDETF